MTKRRIVVTGMGMVSPVGNTVSQSWENIKLGNSGIDTIKSFDTSVFSTHFAGEVKDLDIEQYLAK